MDPNFSGSGAAHSDIGDNTAQAAAAKSVTIMDEDDDALMDDILNGV